MSKKWKSVRKIDEDDSLPTNPDSATGENSEVSVAGDRGQKSRAPRRRRESRLDQTNLAKSSPLEPKVAGTLDSPFQLAEPEEEVAPEPIELPVRPIDVAEQRILIVHQVAATYRLIEETFLNFSEAKVDTTTDVLSAFELAIVRDYQLFIIALNLNEMGGSFFYELVSRAYKTGLNDKKQSPAVVFVREVEDSTSSDDLLQDVRVKAIWSKPLNIERMLDSVSSVIRVKG